ncbi:glycoside hydrolase family 127 protein [Actinoplanes bogorensis]|uniref:Glycoside hydrolase family 127 protein n=1 Tax=Paractinoplanes bogorensis TaxID=1610840 RepID=A0ABS5YNG6_9ACTN|nr:beta-L-arabinofuranosidase domain-containing protein [Actinoplanes bogorensis]MBU2665006.1 glycoside hydrolase family 127 protein [Actinoplanes bogorensis]
MSLPSLSRRRLLQAAGATAVATGVAAVASPAAAALAPARADIGVGAYPFELGQVRLTASRWLDNQNRTLSYLRFIDVDRLLYNFRANHGLSTQGAAACGGWEAPTFEFRSHSQGHFLTAWAQAWAVLGDTTCRDKANYMVAELAKCQANNAARGFNAGYLSGFPESDLNSIEAGTRRGVPYYCLHKTLAGLLDVWRQLGNTQARDVLLAFAGWVDWRTSRLSYAQMQTALTIEFGGMNAVLTDLYQQTGDTRWLTVAQRFDHAAVFDPLASNVDQLNGLHANTQVPKWVGAAREYKATGTTRYRTIAANAWGITVNAHSYVIGGNSQAEHFHAPNAIAAYLSPDAAEACNTYNMLKLTRELWLLDPDRAAYFDFYERALMNHLLGQQNPADGHGHVVYFTALNPGGRRGQAGPVVGGGNYSTDYGTFWCCQGTALETNTKLMDSIYFFNGTTLTVNLFIPSVLTWAARGITVTQTTSFPASDTTTLTVAGSGNWTMRVRIPAWTTGATITVNGAPAGVTATPGSYAAITRTWTSGDVVTVRMPMRVAMRAANDNSNVSAITYGPVVLSGNYGNTAFSTLPALTTSSITRTSSSALTFTATANGATVPLIPFYDAHGHNYTVYWNAPGEGGIATPANFRLVNGASGLVLGVQDMSTADGGLALQWGDTGTLDHHWEIVPDGTAVKLRNVNSAKVLGVENMSTADNARVLQWSDSGTADHRWTIIDAGDGSHRIRNANSGKLLGILNGSTAQGAQAVQDPDNGSADNLWRFFPDGARRIQNLAGGLVLGVQNMSTADGGLVIQWGDSGTADHLWTAVADSGGYFKLRNTNSGKVLGVENAANANGARIMQWADNGTADHRWRLRYGNNGYFRIQCGNGGRVLGVTGASTAAGAQVVLWDDNGTDDHLWRFL